MKISFVSSDSNGNKQAFHSYASFENDIYRFKDKTSPNTDIFLRINSDSIILERKGDVIMNMSFELDKLTDGYYKNKLGLEFEFKALTTSLVIKSNKVEVMYDMFIDNDKLSSHKIIILINN